jgi:hypothetical protein
MTTLRRRLEALEAARGDDCRVVTVVFICDGETGEPAAALFQGGESLTREDGETEATFLARVSDCPATLRPDSVP